MWKNSRCILLTKNYQDSVEKQLKSSGIFSQDFRHCWFFKRFNRYWKERASNLKSWRTGSSSCHCSTASIGQRTQMMRFCFSNAEIVQGLRDEILARTLDVSGSWLGREVVWVNPRTLPLENGTPQPIKWNNDSKKAVIPCSEAPVLWVVETWNPEKEEG